MDNKMNRYFERIRLFLIGLVFLLGAGSMHDAQAASSRDVFHRTYFWHFDGESYVLEYDFPWETYHFYQEKQRVFHNYAVYSYENPHYSLLPDFVRKLQCLADESLMDRETTLRFVIAFVQQLQYQPERGEYPKFPVETLAERGGDCEDTSILLAAMLRELGYSAILLNPPGHMAVAVACDDCNGAALDQNGLKYYYVETTAAGYAIGEVPEDYKFSNGKVHTLAVTRDDLWVLNAFVPKRASSGLVYFVSEDAGTALATSQRGEPVKATATLKTVDVAGKVSKSRSYTVEQNW